MPASQAKSSESVTETPTFRLEDYRFPFPEELIAAEPAAKRDGSRLLVLHRDTGEVKHSTFADLFQYLNPGDCLVLNRSKVVPARLAGKKPTGGKVDLLLVRDLGEGRWSVLSSDLREGKQVLLPEDVSGQVVGRTEDGGWVLDFSNADVKGLMLRHGKPPLPPYILRRRKSAPPSTTEDAARYQTVYAREEGSIAAPTAGLHFTPEIIDRLHKKGVRIAEIILHVGLGTFLPLNAPDVRDHQMLPEKFEVPPAAQAKITKARQEGKRIIAVGTTATRTLETLPEYTGETSLFIRPGHTFKNVDALLTNFHQPASTPLLLASAFAGREKILAAYREAIDRRYRLFSYGDSMLIL